LLIICFSFIATESRDVNRSSLSSSKASSEQQGVTSRSTPVLKRKDEPKAEMESRPAPAVKNPALPVQVATRYLARPVKVVKQPLQLSTASTATLISQAIPNERKDPVIKDKPAPRERPLKPALMVGPVLVPQPGAGFISSTLNKKTDSAKSDIIAVATSAKFTSTMSSNGSASVVTHVPFKIPHLKVDTGKNTVPLALTGTEVSGVSSNRTAIILSRTMKAPTASEIPASTDLKKNTTVPVKRSCPLPPSGTASKRPKPIEHQQEEKVEASASSSTSTITNLTSSTSHEDTKSTQSVCNPANLITAPAALKEVAGLAAAAVNPTTSKKVTM